MLFNSLEFAIFLPVVFALYWFVTNKNLRLQNALIVVASYVFYGWWDWRFLLLIVFSTVIDFSVGLLLKKQNQAPKRKALLWVSIIANLGVLCFFKYYNFFLDNFIGAFSLFGMQLNANSLNIILPVGISFYTFQTLSYTIDVYKGKLKPTSDFIAFSAFVSFFPQLVAGPIERATHLLPQFYSKRVFNSSKAADGLRQILWGLFKKVVIADNFAGFANEIFNNSDQMDGSTLVLGAVFFAFQIYGDFSGYSDIAIGTSRLFGFDLMQNFNFPYFSRDIAEFWRKWHTSLSTWFRDYLYIPLGGSKGSAIMKVRNTIIIFIVSGFWHGANWTFIIWGALNAFYFIPLLLTKNNRNHLNTVAQNGWLPSLKESFQIISTFALTTFAWIFFRAESLAHATNYISRIFSKSLFSVPFIPGLKNPDPINTLITIAVYGLFTLFIFIEWSGRTNKHALERLGFKWKRPIRWALYYFIVITIFWFGGKEQQFIYFQF